MMVPALTLPALAGAPATSTKAKTAIKRFTASPPLRFNPLADIIHAIDMIIVHTIPAFVRPAVAVVIDAVNEIVRTSASKLDAESSDNGCPRMLQKSNAAIKAQKGPLDLVAGESGADRLKDQYGPLRA
jgi:hypothetical protein